MSNSTRSTHSTHIARYLLLTALVIGLATPASVAAEPVQVTEEQQSALGWWSPWYIADYALIGAGITGYVIGGDTAARDDALIGPVYDPDNPASIFDADAVSAVYREEGDGEMVPTVWIHRLIGAGATFIAGMEALRWNRGEGSMQGLHDAFVGYAETVALTAGVTETFKPMVGRLRPDFADRARRHHCSMDDAADLGELCDGYRDRPLSDDRQEAEELLEDGRRSFISGHSSHSFNLLGYTALLVGGHYVWGDNATGQSRSVGFLAQSAMMGGALYITASRVADRRHHRSDVLAGSVVGLGIANFSYWRRFDRDGNLRNAERRRTDLSFRRSAEFTGLTVAVQY